MKKFVSVITVVLAILNVNAQTLTVDLTQRGAVQPTMWGVFFEDINYAADGGLYPEQIKNRSFEFFMPMMGWTEVASERFSLNKNSGAVEILNTGNASNQRFARVKINSETGYALINEGFFGMGIKQGVPYNFSVLVRQPENAIGIRAEILDEQGKVIGAVSVTPDSKEWKRYSASITPTATSGKAKFRMTFTGAGTLDIDMVSLFPTDTWNKRPGGLRADMVQLLYDLKPGFLRFPGGCIVEGRNLAERYQWKKTVGSLDERELMVNRWNTEFKHRQAPDYFQSFGLGFYEYFQLAEDIGASPLPIISCGMACQFNTAELVPMDELDPYIQDALDLIEFANGSESTRWGKLRSDMGHPKPFNMTMIGVGNEQWGTQYIERYKEFERVIKAKYPDIVIVSSAGPFSDGELFDYASAELKTLNAGIVDEHYYRTPDWFFQNANRYDNYDRKGPKIFAGEYAAQSKNTVSPDNKNNWLTALSEAAFMTGLERNADIVTLSSYAPLFAHSEGWQWTPDLIWFDNLRSYATPNYHVQRLFSNNSGTHAISIRNGNDNVIGQDGLYASAVWDSRTKEVVLKLVNSTDQVKTLNVKLPKGVKQGGGTVTVLKGAADDMNSFEDPSRIAPAASTFDGNLSALKLAPSSLTVVRFKTR